MPHVIVTFLASFLIWVLFAALFILWIIDGRIKKEIVLHALFSSILTWIFAAMIKSLFPTDRPFAVNGNSVLTLTTPSDSAFPSAHTAIAFAIATTVWLHDKKIGWLYVFLALVIGIARVFANVHFPIDLFGGAVLGIAVGILADKIHLFSFVGSRKKYLIKGRKRRR